MTAKPFRSFYSYQQASQYLEKDVRTIRKYEGTLFAIDKSLPNRRTKLLPCRGCGGLFKTSIVRQGFCKACSLAGLGRQSQGKIIADRYQAQGNPNYVDGSIKQTFRHQREGKQWVRTVIQRDERCRCCGISHHLQAHHVLPNALFSPLALDPNNGITLCNYHHVELHERRLDLELLPTVYAARESGEQPHVALSKHVEFQALRELPWQQVRRHQLLIVTPKNYRRAIFQMHPQFAWEILGLRK